MDPALNSMHEFLIVGGGPAGLTSALSLGRFGRNVLVCDQGFTRNACTTHMHNFPTRDGMVVSEFNQVFRQDLDKYPTVRMSSLAVKTIHGQEGSFEAELENGEKVVAKKVILATGVIDELPSIPGLQELWGKSIFGCPFCHGYEVRRSKLGFLGSGEKAFKMLSLLSALSSELVFFNDGKERIPREHMRLFRRRGIHIYSQSVKEIVHEGTRLVGIKLNEDVVIPLDYLFLKPKTRSRTGLPDSLGCRFKKNGRLEVTKAGQTSVPGIFAAGDLATTPHSILVAATSGSTVGTTALCEYLREKFCNDEG